MADPGPLALHPNHYQAGAAAPPPPNLHPFGLPGPSALHLNDYPSPPSRVPPPQAGQGAQPEVCLALRPSISKTTRPRRPRRPAPLVISPTPAPPLPLAHHPAAPGAPAARPTWAELDAEAAKDAAAAGVIFTFKAD